MSVLPLVKAYGNRWAGISVLLLPAYGLLFTAMKRLFDIVASVAGLTLLSPVMLLTALLIRLDSPGPVFFRQHRVGKDFRPFQIYKFRTMVQEAPLRGGLITVGVDSRITGVGNFLRQTKLDELPQLINVLKGDMSLVGPRPEVPQYVEMFRKDYEQILSVRPGITDLASLKYRDEATVLGRSVNPEQEYVERVLPDKIKLAKEYTAHASVAFDVALIFKTFVRLFHYGKL
jgi:lipopolysaccharide/colanic/teichoic acid biosynthesis glycosyltransferase